MPALRTDPPVSPSGVFVQRFSATRRGARLARLLAALQLVEWGHPRGTEDHDAVTIIVAELTSNAVLHGRVPGRDFGLRLHCDNERGVIQIAVSDTRPARPVPALGAPDVATAVALSSSQPSPPAGVSGTASARARRSGRIRSIYRDLNAHLLTRR